jgi:hypothetical protein
MRASIMADALAHLDQVLGYVYDQSGGTSAESVQILEYAESIGLDMDGAYTIVWACRDSGLGRDTSGMGNPCIQITPAGLAYIREMRDRRDDPALRAAACRTGLLRWFYRQHIAAVHMPITEEFERTAEVHYEGGKFTEVEIQNAAEYLANKGLIKGIEVAEIRGPVRAEITTEGIDCATDWAGDVAGYLRDQRGYGPTQTYNGPYIQGDAPGAQMAWMNRDVIQNRNDGQQIAPGFELLAQAIADLIAQLPTLGLQPQDQADVQEVAEEVMGEVAQSEPNRGRLRRAVAALRGFLMPIATGAIAGVSDQAREETEKLIEHLTSAIS